MITVYFSSGLGNGFNGPTQVSNGTTIASFIAQRLPGIDPKNLYIAVNGNQGVDPNTVLGSGDRITASQDNVKGARLAA